jgi:hypothetical protein
MKEKLQALSRWIKEHIDMVVLIIFAVLFLFVGIQIYTEMNYTPPPLEPPLPWKPEDYLPNENFDKVVGMMKESSPIEEDEQYVALAKFNIFDYKIVRDRDMIQKEMDNKFQQALKFFNDGDLKRSKNVLTEILSSWPMHINSRDLLDKINAQLNPTPTPSPTPGPLPRGPMMPGMENLPPEMR